MNEFYWWHLCLLSSARLRANWKGIWIDDWIALRCVCNRSKPFQWINISDMWSILIHFYFDVNFCRCCLACAIFFFIYSTPFIWRIKHHVSPLSFYSTSSLSLHLSFRPLYFHSFSYIYVYSRFSLSFHLSRFGHFDDLLNVLAPSINKNNHPSS